MAATKKKSTKKRAKVKVGSEDAAAPAKKKKAPAKKKTTKKVATSKKKAPAKKTATKKKAAKKKEDAGDYELPRHAARKGERLTRGDSTVHRWVKKNVDGNYYLTSDVAKHLGYTTITIRKWINNDEVQSPRIEMMGNMKVALFTKEDVARFKEYGKVMRPGRRTAEFDAAVKAEFAE